MNHHEKIKLATRMNFGIRRGCFDSPQWKNRTAMKHHDIRHTNLPHEIEGNYHDDPTFDWVFLGVCLFLVGLGITGIVAIL